MIVQLTPEYKLICDRCGKEKFPDKDGHLEYHRVVFKDYSDLKIKNVEGEVCQSCHDEFLELAHNFFDEVNKEN